MSRLAIPVVGQFISVTGDRALQADVVLRLRNNAGNYVHSRFRIDSASDVTTFGAFQARQLGLPIPINPSAIGHNPTGLVVRAGLLRFCIEGMDATEYVVSCFFLGDPAIVPSRLPFASFPRALLQPLALLDHLKITMEKDPTSIGAPHGEVIIEKK